MNKAEVPAMPTSKGPEKTMRPILPLIAQFPSVYHQGPGALAQLAEVLGVLKVDRPLVLAGPSAWASVGSTLSGMKGTHHVPFTGECTEEEIARVNRAISENQCQAVVGLGGGKVIDTARAAAFLSGGLPFISAPTIASTDAPTSATTVIYKKDGTFSHYLRSRNPAAVLVDTEIIARAPVRYLIAGMGDALSTWFEAESCKLSGAANVCNGSATLAALAIARLCYDIILVDGLVAIAACKAQVVTPALERVVEANTLLSGIGFESGGLASAHAVHNGLTSIPSCHHALHGEKVAFGVLVGLHLTGAASSLIEEVTLFCNKVGLPVCLADLGCTQPLASELRKAAEIACSPGDSIHNESVAVNPDKVLAAMITADHLGSEFPRKFK